MDKDTMNHRDFVKGVSAFAGGALAFQGLSRSTALAQAKSSTASKGKPNIVLIFMDNFGWGELGCYGGSILR